MTDHDHTPDITTPTPEQFARMGLLGTRSGIALDATPVLVELYLYGFHHGLEQADEQEHGATHEEAHEHAMEAVSDWVHREIDEITAHVMGFVQQSAEAFAAKAQKATEN